MMTPFIIAIDGPAASGKGTLAQKLAEHYQIAYLDTGLSYRAVAYEALQQAITPENKEALIEAAQRVNLEQLNSQKLSAHDIGQLASKIAIVPEVRQILVAKQQAFAQTAKRAIIDGRDIGTIVCPKAQAKLFIMADVTVRAQRRFAQLRANGQNPNYEQLLMDLQERDQRDQNRKEGPLKPAEDAYLLDSSKMDIVQTVKCARAYIDPLWQKLS